MGTRINALFDHNLSDFNDRKECLNRLKPSVLAATEVYEYWLAADPDNPHVETAAWQAEPVSPHGHDLRHYTGPGSLFLTVTEVAARVRTGGRWRGFVSIEPLRRVHLAAFHVIARALGALRMAVYLDSDAVDEIFWDGRPLRDCVDWMQVRWGPRQESVERIDPEIVAAADRCPPPIWFLVEVER